MRGIPFTQGARRTKAAGRRGGRTRGQQLSAARVQLWLERYPGVDPAIAAAIYTAGYNAGHQRARLAAVRRLLA